MYMYFYRVQHSYNLDIRYKIAVHEIVLYSLIKQR
jgi:hypothetical protein